MANTDFTISRNDIFTDVLELMGVLEPGDSPSANQITSCARTLNAMIKHLQASEGINFYAVRETFLFLISGKGNYNQLDYNGTTGLDVDRNHIYVSKYEMVDFTDIATGATSVNVNEAFISGDPVASAVAGDVVGIPLDDGTVHWAEITSVGTSGSFSKSFTFTGHALPDDANNSKKMIVGITYPGRPVSIRSATLRQVFTNDERPIETISFSEYNYLTDKDSAAEVNQIMYKPNVTYGDLRTWPIQNDYNHCLVMWAQLPLDDVESDVSLNADTRFPQEYNLMLIYNLAEALLPKYTPPGDVQNMIIRLAMKYKDEIIDFDSENELYLQPELR